jgi:hypothetical protein
MSRESRKVGWYGTGVTAADHLRGRLEGPVGQPSLARTLEVDGTLAGVGNTFRRRFKGPGGPLVLLDSIDVCIAPTYQTNGLARLRQEITRRRYRQEFGMGIGYTLNPAMQHLARQWGNAASRTQSASVVCSLLGKGLTDDLRKGVLVLLEQAGGPYAVPSLQDLWHHMLLALLHRHEEDDRIGRQSMRRLTEPYEQNACGVER